ncbi:hypothetical protein FRC04_007073 [Tulasnella sp. 424]|nr:hypothetical protein FRC04_007073 [Tulasnella sp. 424]KAG8976905.1 hypothetical protein FRC05_002842 [Tulasnella sp. 425]
MPVSTKTGKSRTSSGTVKKAPRKSQAKAPKTKGKRARSEEEFSSGDDDDSDAYKEEIKEDSESEPESLDSDDLDGEKPATKKRKRAAAKSSPRKKATPKGGKRQELADDEEFDEEVGDGVEIVGKVVKAPTTGRVPPGQISQNTLDFLKQLTNPKCNDREWFKLHEPVYRLAEKEWVDFVDKLMEKVSSDVDEEVPPLPAKDVIHRIYRDVGSIPFRIATHSDPSRLSRSVSLTTKPLTKRTSQPQFQGQEERVSSRIIIFASGGKSFMAAGLWCPGKNELATLRSNILRDSTPLRNVLSEKEFVKFFGAPKKHPKGERQSIFGHEDELKVAPKGIDKNHKDIDLLKVRSPAVIHRFLDSEVLEPDFMDKLCGVMRIMQPFVHLLNEMVTVPPDDTSDDEE